MVSYFCVEATIFCDHYAIARGDILQESEHYENNVYKTGATPAADLHINTKFEANYLHEIEH
jgi:hypothetical protein